MLEPVTNNDYAAFSATFENGAGAIEVSRLAAGHANSLISEVAAPSLRTGAEEPSRPSAGGCKGNERRASAPGSRPCNW